MELWDDLDYQEIGAYKLGCFYSESFSGVPLERDLILPREVGRSGGPMMTLRLIVLLHETSHLLHDLNLGTCMDLDYSLDFADGVLKAALRQMQDLHRGQGVRCPLLKGENRWAWMADKTLREAFEIVESMEAMKGRLLGRTPGLSRYALGLSGTFRGLEADLDGLSGTALMEGLVAVKTAGTIAERATGPEDMAYLQENLPSLKILPETMAEPYQVARRIFDATIGVHLTGGYDYRLDTWPEDYTGSPRMLCDLGFVYLADIALHIPPAFVREEWIKQRKYAADDFIPVKRFCRMLGTLLRWGRFPMGNSQADPEHFYNDLFDEFARVHHWPTVGETNQQWKTMLGIMREQRKEAADGYRFRMVVEREKRPDAIIMRDPLSACWSQSIPVLHLTPTGYKFFRGLQTTQNLMLMPLEFADMMADEVFFTNLPLWKNAPDEIRLDDRKAMEDWNLDANNSNLIMQEAVYRSLCRELYRALLYKKSLTCPFSKQGCRAAQPACKRITELGSIPKEGCCLYAYLQQDGLDPNTYYWQ